MSRRDAQPRVRKLGANRNELARGSARSRDVREDRGRRQAKLASRRRG